MTSRRTRERKHFTSRPLCRPWMRPPNMQLPLNQQIADAPRKFGEPIVPLIPNIQRPKVERQSLEARLNEGLLVMYRRGCTAEQLWGYAATGQCPKSPGEYEKLRDYQAPGELVTGLVAREWTEAIMCFRNRVPMRIQRDRDATVGLCAALLKQWINGTPA
jgi:hypothetical protein